MDIFSVKFLLNACSLSGSICTVWVSLLGRLWKIIWRFSEKNEVFWCRNRFCICVAIFEWVTPIVLLRWQLKMKNFLRLPFGIEGGCESETRCELLLLFCKRIAFRIAIQLISVLIDGRFLCIVRKKNRHTFSAFFYTSWPALLRRVGEKRFRGLKHSHV